ncbi:MAG: hypothetical protein EOO45_19280 [Flavobacterium sp.]|nr:MAG: hypothetical protein EOO45_19280 [Flavobacterium sp.]
MKFEIPKPMKTPLPLITLIAFAIVITIITAFQNPTEEHDKKKPETLGELHVAPDTGLKPYGTVVYDAENFM